MKEYNDLSSQATQADEDLLKAEEDLAAKRSELDKANDDLTAARGVSNSQEDFLNRMSALNVLAART